MKKRIILLIGMAIISFTANAQQVFNEIYSKAYKMASDPKEDREVRKIESFKVDALDYLRTRTLENAKGDSVTSGTYARLDSLAYFMYDYVNLFSKEYSKADNKGKNKCIKLFRDCSLALPLYKDEDEDLVLAYCKNQGYITQFSLDTNWIKANAEVRRRIREQ